MKIDFARATFGQEEIEAVNRVLQTHWLASGSENEAFEKEFAEYVKTNYAVCVNSGSSANLLALNSLALHPNDKVLTSACGFPATLSPTLHLGLQPALVDYDLETHNIDVSQVIRHLHEVKAVILAHTMGNPLDIEKIVEYAHILDVPVIEDCCEAAGSFVKGRAVGSFGTLGTFSFYPAHQMTAGGGGGMVVTNNETLYKHIRSLRDWGKMYDWDSGRGGNATDYSSPIGYHRGYTYETIGYNFKLPEMNAAFGREQLKKLDGFALERMRNFDYLNSSLEECSEFIKIDYDPKDVISWFGFPMTLKDGSKLKRNDLGEYLESKGIRHRPFFAGNILRQPAFERYFGDYSSKLAAQFPIADKLMHDSLFIGCWAGMTQEMLDYIVERVEEYVDQSKKS